MVTWTRVGRLLFGPSFLQTQTIVNTVEGTYENVLTFIDLPLSHVTGEFGCNVTNDRGTSNTVRIGLTGEYVCLSVIETNLFSILNIYL